MGDKKRAWCGDRTWRGKVMDVGRMCVYTPYMEQPYACTLHGITAAIAALSNCSWRVCWVHVRVA